MKKLALVLLLLIPLVVVSKPKLYGASHCVMNHGPIPLIGLAAKAPMLNTAKCGM
jgi:hypothetical protein